MNEFNSDRYIFHILPESDWRQALDIGEYRAASLDTEGFIHFSKQEQVLRTANLFFKGQNGLYLVKVDTGLLGADLRFDDIGTGEKFPHLYGPLNLSAVIQVCAFPPNLNGSFSWPDGF